MAGDPKYLEKACSNGGSNGEIAGRSGPEKPKDKNQSDLDRSQYGSKEGLLEKGKK